MPKWQALLPCTALMKVGSVGPDKMEALLHKHEHTDCVRLESGMSERDGVLPT